MTNKEAAGILISQAIVLGRASGKSTLERIRIEAICKAVEALEKQATQEWISVDDRLPEYSGHYLVVHRNKHNGSTSTAIAAYIKCKIGEWWANDETHNVTYWMPLPEMPKEND